MTRILLLVVLLLPGPLSVADPVRVSLSPVAVVDADTVTLGDVAAIGGADEAVVRALGNVALAAAPEPARAKVIASRDMELLLLRRGIDPGRLRFDGADTVQVVREGQLVAEDEILRALRKHVRERTGWKDDDFDLAKLRGIREISLPPGPYAIRVESLSEDLADDARFRVAVTAEGTEPRTLLVSAWVSRFVDAWAARRDIRRGERISAGDLDLVRVDRSRMSSRQADGLLREPSDIIGLEARAAIPAGRPLTADMAQHPTLVARGDRVVVRLLNGAVRISAPAVARRSGRLGDVLQVQNLATGGYLDARVTAPGVVTVD